MNFLVFALSFLFIFTTVILLLILIIKIFLFLIRRSEFPSKFARITLGCIVVSICLIMYRPLTFTFDKIDMNNPYMQKGKTVSSPNLQYVATSLYEPYGGAAGGVNLIVYVTDTKINEDKIIYYADAQNIIEINWLDNETLQVINKSYNDFTISLNVTNEIYHGNGYACSSLLMKDSYQYCYSKYKAK